MYTFREICEIVITVIILITISYRVAVVYDWVPQDFQPFAVVKNQYKQLKYAMLDESKKPDFWGKTTYYILSGMRGVETYFSDKEKNEKLEDQTVARCQENVIFRFFMGMGMSDKDKTKCIGRDEFVDKTVNDTKFAPSNKKTGTNPAPGATTPKSVTKP